MRLSNLEEQLERAAVVLGQSTSRRSALATISKAVLGALGLTLVEPVVFDRRTAGSHNCGNWKYCGLYGTPCACCGSGGTDTKCPTFLTKSSSFWHRCCSGWDVWYHDCCGSGSCSAGCHAHACGPAQQSWCGSTPGAPVCTLAIVAASCCLSPLC